MNASPTPSVLRALPARHRERLVRTAREVSFTSGVRLFEEGGRADRFWIIRTGRVELDMRVPGRRAAVIENVGPNELVGWSWLFGPHLWHLGAGATTPVRAWQFDAEAVRALCREDSVLANAVDQWVGEVLAHRLRAARTRLLDLYAPYGAGASI
ncbi:cyclic nucleotide-binding domain-containing protein [Streptomyces sp. NPDC007851]|uniref:cyclic nucleotide-binding domain-containing protein n=1 Tax=Streptomyces sp. NPDC007851 TaxID=3155008 RepID=UPI0033F15F1B